MKKERNDKNEIEFETTRDDARRAHLTEVHKSHETSLFGFGSSSTEKKR